MFLEQSSTKRKQKIALRPIDFVGKCIYIRMNKVKQILLARHTKAITTRYLASRMAIITKVCFVYRHQGGAKKTKKFMSFLPSMLSYKEERIFASEQTKSSKFCL